MQFASSSSSSQPDASGRSLYVKACTDLRIKPNVRIIQVRYPLLCLSPHPLPPSHPLLQALECEVLDLTDCGLRPQDAQALAACFPTNANCTAVILDNNRLGDLGFIAILQVIRHSHAGQLWEQCRARTLRASITPSFT